MPYNGSGTYNLYTPGNPVVTDTVISSSVFNSTMADVATALSSVITRNGQSPATANIPLGNNKLTGVASGTAASDAATIANLQAMTGVYVATVGGTATAITLSPSPAISSYAVGQVFAFIAADDCAGETTVAVSGLSAKAITKSGAEAVGYQDWLSGQLVFLMYDGTEFQLFNSPTDKEFVYVNKFDGIDPTGATAIDTGWAAALTAIQTLMAATNKSIDVVWAGKYLLDGTIPVGGDGIRVGIKIPYISINDVDPHISFIGNAFFLANNNSMEIVRWCDSRSGIYGTQKGSFTFYGNGKTSVTGLSIAPEDVTQTTTVVHQQYGTFAGWRSVNCTEGLTMRVGPRVTGVDSGCSYNTIANFDVYGCTRSIWLRDSTNLCSGVNRNTFMCGTVGHGATNTGMQIDAGSTNKCISVDFEGIYDANGSGTSPNAARTAVYIKATDTFGLANSYNSFVACYEESNTVPMNNNAITQIFGGFWRVVALPAATPPVTGFTGSVKPMIMGIGSTSFAPESMSAYRYADGITGYPNAYAGMLVDFADDGFPWTDNSLNIGDLTNVAALSGGIQSKTKSTSHEVNWILQFNFQASVAATRVTCNVPIAPASIYTTAATNNPYFTFWVNNGGGFVQAQGGFTSAGLLYINAPSGNWDTGGTNNQVFVNISYKR